MIEIKKETLSPLHVVVRFGASVPDEAQGRALLAMEKNLRALTGKDVRVFKDRMGDDSKLRVKMTQQQRDNL